MLKWLVNKIGERLGRAIPPDRVRFFAYNFIVNFTRIDPRHAQLAVTATEVGMAVGKDEMSIAEAQQIGRGLCECGRIHGFKWAGPKGQA